MLTDGEIYVFRLKFGPSGKNLVELVIEGQYVVSNTHCPALHDCDLE